MTRQFCQSGAVSIEFALSFVILMALLYGIVGYTVPLLLSASYQQLASDTLREALVWQHRQQETDAETIAHAKRVIESSTSKAESCGSTFLTMQSNESGEEWNVCLSTPTNSIFPSITLMGWEFPPLPDEIIGSATLYAR